jgi:hypothetical protein
LDIKGGFHCLAAGGLIPCVSALEPLGQRREEAMMLRIIHGKLKPGTWDSYERAYKDVMVKAGKIPGLRGRWLATRSTIPMPDIR